MSEIRNIVVLGSTGSIGQSTLEVAENDDQLTVLGISAHSQLDLAAEQCQRHQIPYLIATDAESAAQFDRTKLPRDTQLLVQGVGADDLSKSDNSDVVEEFVQRNDVDAVVSAIVGSAGLRGSWAAIEAGKRVALANKETLVVAGSLIMPLAEKTGAELIPVDSEHSAIFQSLHTRPSGDGSISQTLNAGQRTDVERIILTASGGAFRNKTSQELQHVTLKEALQHPTWDMGAKITIDSATMLNKALEIIEARWLFGLSADQIDVVIHPQSIIHSMVEFCDGSVIAQMSPPDMKLPIQYALTYPQRRPGVARRFDWTQNCNLTFEVPDFERFPALRLGHEVAEKGGTAGAVLNAAKEKAVQLFIDGELSFHEIVDVCREVLNHHTFDPNPTLEDLLSADRWARNEVDRWTVAS